MTSSGRDTALKQATAELYRQLDERLAATNTARRVHYMNFGYRCAEGESSRAPQVGLMYPNRDSLEMLYQVLGESPLPTDRVVEIGCGRGGNLLALTTHDGVRDAIGVDITAASLVHASAAAGAGGPRYVRGDAESVPLRSGAADVVVSIETSCHYPDIERFYAEVGRIVSPGGRFAYADLLPTDLLDALVAALDAQGLRCVQRRDITANVVRSRRARGRRASRAVDQDTGATSQEWTGAEGSLIFDLMNSGDLTYFAMRFERDGRPTVDLERRVLSEKDRARIRDGSALGAELLHFG